MIPAKRLFDSINIIFKKVKQCVLEIRKTRTRDTQAFRLKYYRLSVAVHAHKGFGLTHLSEAVGVET